LSTPIGPPPASARTNTPLRGSPSSFKHEVSMSTDIRNEALARRIQDLYAGDAQPARMRRSPRRSSCPGLPLPQIVRTAMEGYLNIVGRPYLRASQVRLARR
jgi:hypothetical protein